MHERFSRQASKLVNFLGSRTVLKVLGTGYVSVPMTCVIKCIQYPVPRKQKTLNPNPATEDSGLLILIFVTSNTSGTAAGLQFDVYLSEHLRTNSRKYNNRARNETSI